MPDFKIIIGDALTALQAMPDDSVDCCVTSPPYWGLRDYGHAGQMGLEPTPADYVASMVALFREVGRVLDPFTGSGTVGVVSLSHGRRFLGVELNPVYAAMAERRINASIPGPRLFPVTNQASD